MADWQVGDAALCVDARPCGVFGPTDLKAGVIYTVIAVKTAHCQKTGLYATGLKVAGSRSYPPWHHQKRFEKAPRLEPTAEDREVIAHMAGQEVEA